MPPCQRVEEPFNYSARTEKARRVEFNQFYFLKWLHKIKIRSIRNRLDEIKLSKITNCFSVRQAKDDLKYIGRNK